MLDVNVIKGSYLEIDAEMRHMLLSAVEHASRTFWQAGGLFTVVLKNEGNTTKEPPDGFLHENVPDGLYELGTRMQNDLITFREQLEKVEIPDAVMTINLSVPAGLFSE
jgi:hypothetical protein